MCDLGGQAGPIGDSSSWGSSWPFHFLPSLDLSFFSYWDPANNAIFEKIGLRRSRYVWFTTLFWSKDVQSIKIAPRFWTKGRRPVEMLQLQRMWPHQPKMPELRLWMSPRRQRDWENGDRGITYITVYPTIYHWGWFIIGFGTFIGIRNFRHWWYIVHAAGPRCFVTLTVIICSWKGSELRCRMSKEYRHFVQLEALDIFGLWSHVESVWRSRWSPSQTQRRGLFGQVLSFTGIHRYFHLCILQAVETEVEQIGDKLDTLTKKISNVRGLYLSRFLDLPCLACLACLAKLLTAVRSLPFHSHKTWQLHHCWYMIRWDRGCFGGWFTWRQWRQRVFPEVTCMNACSTFPNLQKLPRFLMKRPQNWHRRASQLWNDEQF